MRAERNFSKNFVLALMSSACCLRLNTVVVQAFSAYSTATAATTSVSTMVNTARATSSSTTTAARNRLPFSPSGLLQARPRQLSRPRALPCHRLASSASDSSIPRSSGGAAFRAADNLAGGSEDFAKQVSRDVATSPCVAHGGWPPLSVCAAAANLFLLLLLLLLGHCDSVAYRLDMYYYFLCGVRCTVAGAGYEYE